MSLRAVKSRLQSYFKPAGVVSPEETDDAAAASDRTVPPSQSRSTAERERPKTVDLSTPSPEATRRATQTHYEPTNIHASTHTPKQRTRLAHNRPPGDEERLLRTNTRLPADATRLLPAQHVFDTMRLKPGAARSFKPQNTIDGVRHTQQSRAQPRTYASSQKPSSRLDFLDRVDIDSPTVTGSHTVPEISSQPPAKRRKVQLSRTQKQEVISLDEEDEGEEEESDIELPAPRMRPPSQISRSVSARSQRSAESDRTVTIGPPISGFQAADKLGNSHRKKRRTNESVLTTSSCHWPETATSYSSNPMRGTKATSPIPVDDDELAPKSRTLTQRNRARGVDIIQNSSSPADKRDSFTPTAAKMLRQRNFARMNPSTSPPRGEPAQDARANRRKNSDLRNAFKRNGDPIDDVDELQADLFEFGRQQVVDQGKSPAKCAPAANTGAKRNATVESTRWPLHFARTFHFEASDAGLVMKPYDSSVSHIMIPDANGSLTIVKTIDLQKVIEGLTDGDTQIRIRGPRGLDGNQYCFDITFANRNHLVQFRSMYLTHMQKRLVTRTMIDMDKIFKKPLPFNDKVGAGSLIDDEEISLLVKRTKNNCTSQQQKSTKQSPRLIEHLESSAVSIPNMDEGSPVNSRASGALQRPVRITRTSHPVHDVDAQDKELSPAQQVVKYSVEKGLGKAWDKALQYGTGRRRALVEFSDLPRLDEEEFLNDSLLDFYLIYLFDQANLPPNKVYFFNTHFFTTLTRNTGRNSKINYPAVERWTSREDIFGYDYIVVPINENIHWYLAIICNVSNISRKFDLNSLDDLGESPPPPPTQVTRNDEHTDERHAPTPPHTADLQGTPVDGRNDEEMLFNIHEDTEIDLVDTNTVVHDNDAKEDSKTTGLTSETGIAGLEKLHITESIPEENLDNPASSAAPEKRKTKRKVGPPQKKFNPKEPIIIVLDSLGQNHSTAVRALKDYLLEEGKSKRGMEASITQNGFYAKNTHIPMQENYSDCGVFLLGYAQKFLDSPDDFVERILSNQMESEKDWPDMKASNLRDEMRSTLLRLGGEQQAERKRTRLDKKGRMPAPLPVEADSSMGHVKPTLLSPITLKPAQTGSTSQPASKPTFGAADTGGSPAKMPRKYSPMVVIPSPKRPYAQLDGTYQQNERHMLPEEQQHSPKRQKMEPNVRRSLSKSPAKIPPTHSKVIAPTTDLAHDMRGSSYDPISIDDSQDTIVVATPKVVHRSGPRTQLRSRSPMEAMQRRENSVNNAIKSPSNSPVQVRQSVEKETYPGDELIAKLKSPAKSTSRKHRSLSKTYVSEKLGAKQEKHMADEGEGFHEESTVDDGVIGETPPQEQASPPASEWKEGDALLL